jgi:hypothetical protein
MEKNSTDRNRIPAEERRHKLIMNMGKKIAALARIKIAHPSESPAR